MLAVGSTANAMRETVSRGAQEGCKSNVRETATHS